MSKCSNYPDAPHGFNRSASHAEGRYVCDCECWIPDDEEITMTELTQQQVIDYLMGENGTFSERKSARIAANLIEQQQAEIDALKAHVERLRDALQNHTAQPVCCGMGDVEYSPDGEPIGQQCCGRPDFELPQDVAELLSATPKQFLAEHDSE